ncbi:MAG: S66 peptidase family protein [Myxococcota bacterium]
MLPLPIHARIAVVAPAGVFSTDRLARGIEVVRSWGHSVVEAPNLRCQHRYCAGTASERTADLIWALTEPGIDAVWFARGGYGTVHTLANLPWDLLDGRPVIGFSDATALHAAFWSKGFRTVHGPVLQGLCDYDLQAAPPVVCADPESRKSVQALLSTGRAAPLPAEPFCGPDAVVRGPVVGGNLSVLASLSGTPWALRGQGAIVVLEDVGEAPYRIDRLLTQLIDCGTFDGAVGVALGDFNQCRSEVASYGVRDVLHDLLQPLGLPVVAGVPVGHTAHNYAWIHGEVGELRPDGIDWP